MNNTVVVVCGDHGWFLGEKLRYAKTHLWEESTRVPLIIRVPGSSESSLKSNRIVNLLDLYPTLVELCGLPTRAGLDGRSFADWQKTPSETGQPTLTTMGFKNHSVRSATHRFTRYADGTEELYDHQADPLERRNLITDVKHKPVAMNFELTCPSMMSRKPSKTKSTRNDSERPWRRSRRWGRSTGRKLNAVRSIPN